MSKLSNITSLIFLSILLICTPAFAIQDSKDMVELSSEEQMSRFFGDSFFESAKDINARKEEEINVQAQDFYRDFRSVPAGRGFSFESRRSLPPVKKMRLAMKKKIAEKPLKKKSKKQKQTEFNADLEQKIEEVNPVELEEEAETEAIMKCKYMKYLPETNQLLANGGIEINFPKAAATITANKMTYDREDAVIQLFDDVKISKNGYDAYGDYLRIDMNEESAVLDNIRASKLNLSITAEHGYMFGDTVISKNGKIKSEDDNVISMTSSGFGDEIRRMIVPREEIEFLLTDIKGHKLFVEVNEIKINAKKCFDVVHLKKIKIYNNKGKKLASLPSMKFYTNKERDFFEANYPELGSKPEFGMYVGPGFVWETPLNSTLKIIPTVNHQSKVGFGGIGRYQSATNKTEFGYNTAAEKFVLEGYQALDDNLILQYAVNSYMDSGFLGRYWTGYGGELVYKRAYHHNDFLYRNAGLNINHNLSAGILKENDRSKHNTKYSGYHDMSTVRLRYMLDANQVLLALGNPEYKSAKDIRRLVLSVDLQGSAAVYGTGDTQFIGRIGPKLTTQYKLWKQDVGYYLSGYSDETPLLSLDSYRYGKSNIYLREYLRLHKFLTLGFHGSYKVSDDMAYDYQADKDTRLREASFFVALGPDDCKINFGWDVVRNRTYFGISVAANTKGSTLGYKTLVAKDPEAFGKSDAPVNDYVSRSQFVPPSSPYRKRANVVDLVDSSLIMPSEPL